MRHGMNREGIPSNQATSWMGLFRGHSHTARRSKIPNPRMQYLGVLFRGSLCGGSEKKNNSLKGGQFAPWVKCWYILPAGTHRQETLIQGGNSFPFLRKKTWVCPFCKGSPCFFLMEHRRLSFLECGVGVGRGVKQDTF